MPEKRCKVCRKTLVRRRDESDYQWQERPTCSRSCGAKYGRRQREDYVAFQPHRCLLEGCKVWVPRVEGEHDSDYRRRRYCCTEHSDIGRARTILTKPSGKPPRKCACGCGAVFVPKRHTVRFATRGCANRCRHSAGPRPTKVCQCGCGESFERPVGMSSTEWDARRFLDRRHHDRGQGRVSLPGARPQLAKVCQCGCGESFERPTGFSDAAWSARRFLDREHRDRWQTRPGASRTKVCQCGCGESFERPTGISSTEWDARRFLNREHHDLGRATERLEGHPVASTPVQEAPKPTPPAWRPPAPVVARSERVTRRPSFGLTRRSASS